MSSWQRSVNEDARRGIPQPAEPHEWNPEYPSVIPPLSGSAIGIRSDIERKARNEALLEEARKERAAWVLERKQFAAQLERQDNPANENAHGRGGLPPINVEELFPLPEYRRDPHGHVIQYWPF